MKLTTKFRVCNHLTEKLGERMPIVRALIQLKASTILFF